MTQLTTPKTRAEKSLVRQHDQLDCGVACLLSLVRYYGGESSFEQIRRLSGADLSGTSLLGLKEAAQKLGFEAEGYEADVVSLIEHGQPVILHVELEGGLHHYVVCYGQADGLFEIGDPAQGVQLWDKEKLQKLWKSGACLVLSPSEGFVRVQQQNDRKKRWFLDQIREDIPLLLISAGVGVLVAMLGLAMSVYSQQLIDVILPSRNPTKIVVSTVLLTILLLARVGISALREFLLIRQSREFGVRLNQSFYEKLLFLPKSYFDTRKTGDFVARLNDTRRIQGTVSTLAGSLLVDLFMVVASLGLLFYYEWRIGVLSLLVLPLYFFIIYRQNTAIREAQNNVMVAYALSESNYVNTIQGIADVKNQNKQSFFSNINRFLYGAFQEMVYRSGLVQVRLSIWAGVASVGFVAVILALTLWQVYLDQMRIGEMTAILGMVSMLLPAVAGLALISVPLNDAKIAFDRMYDFLNVPPETTTDGQREFVFQRLDFESVSFRFPGKKQFLKDLSFSLERGKVVSIISESGGGKSLICQLIQRFYEPEEGRLTVNGSLPLSDIDMNYWRQVVGIVPQQVHLFNGTVLENICFSAHQPEIDRTLRWLADCGFTPFLDSLPQGVLTLIGEEGVKLSGGQRQMIGLARVLATQPQLLLLDEATASLDRHSEGFVLGLIEKLKEKMAVLLITHRLHTLATICDAMYVLEGGLLTHRGDHDTLMLSTNMYSDYWHSWKHGSTPILHSQK